MTGKNDLPFEEVQLNQIVTAITPEGTVSLIVRVVSGKLYGFTEIDEHIISALQTVIACENIARNSAKMFICQTNEDIKVMFKIPKRINIYKRISLTIG